MRTPETSPAPVGFGGQYGYYSDTQTGLVMMTHRYYDAGKGRFINRDPIGAAGGINLYGFVGNNPVTGADPEGTRDLTADDKSRLQRLRAYGRSSRKHSVTIGIEAAADEITAAIHGVPGRTDPPSLRAIFWAIDELGDTKYGKGGTINDGYNVAVPADQWKCNIFAADAYAVGARVGWDGKSGVPTNRSLRGHHHPYAANDLADRSTRVRNFPVVDGRHREMGDIAAFRAFAGDGHTTLYLGGGMCIYAGQDDVKIDSIAYVLLGHAYDTYRRYRP